MKMKITMLKMMMMMMMVKMMLCFYPTVAFSPGLSPGSLAGSGLWPRDPLPPFPSTSSLPSAPLRLGQRTFVLQLRRRRHSYGEDLSRASGWRSFINWITQKTNAAPAAALRRIAATG